MKKLFLLLLLTSLSYADIIDGIALTINNEAITLYEIQQERKINKQSVKKAVDNLIRTKLEKIEADKRGITVSNRDVLDDIKNIAKQNNMTLAQFYEAMSSVRNLSESQTKERTREKLLKQKLFNAVTRSQLEKPTDEELEEYYNLHLHEYQTPTSIDTILYQSQSQEALKQKISNPMMNVSNVTIENTRVDLARINPRLAQLLIETEDGKFTPVLPRPGAGGSMVFYVLNKNDIKTPSLEEIRSQVEGQLIQDQREHIVNEHFQRMRINANIKIIRLPK